MVSIYTKKLSLFLMLTFAYVYMSFKNENDGRL